MKKSELCYYNGFDISNATINIEKHNKLSNLTDNEKILFRNEKKNKVNNTICLKTLKNT